MKALFFLLALLGISALLSISLLQKPIEITSKESISFLTPNTKVEFSGEVLSEKTNRYNTELFFQSNLSVKIEKTSQKLANKTVKINAIIKEYKGEKYLQANKLWIGQHDS